MVNDNNKTLSLLFKIALSLVFILTPFLSTKVEAQVSNKALMGSNIFAEVGIGTIMSNQNRYLYYDGFSSSWGKVWDNPSFMITANIGNRFHFKVSPKVSVGFQLNWLKGGVYLLGGNYINTKEGRANLYGSSYKNFDGLHLGIGGVGPSLALKLNDVSALNLSLTYTNIMLARGNLGMGGEFNLGVHYEIKKVYFGLQLSYLKSYNTVGIGGLINAYSAGLVFGYKLHSWG